MPQFGTMTVTVEDEIATLTMDDGRGNALNFAALESLQAALQEARSARVLIFRGRETIFCGGLDLPALAPLPPPQVEEFFAAFDHVHQELLSFPRPIVTCASGSAIAGGAILFCAGDVRLATEAGKIGINEAVLGFNFPTPALEIVRVALGDQHLAAAAIPGRLYEGDERVRVGFATEVVPAERLDERTRAAAMELAHTDPEAVALIREQIRRPAIARIREYSASDRARFLQRWHAPETQQRIQSLVARLTRR